VAGVDGDGDSEDDDDYDSEDDDDEDYSAASAIRGAGGSSLPSSASWAQGLSPASKRYEWLVNCYQMRVDDDFKYSACYRGPYDMPASKAG
jgi:hypothetical protein